MTSPAVEAASTAAAVAATTWAENLGGGAGDRGRPGRQTCWALWREDLAAFEVLQPRGDSLRSMVSIQSADSIRLLAHSKVTLFESLKVYDTYYRGGDGGGVTYNASFVYIYIVGGHSTG